jgi:hypothetical protein
LKNNKSKSKRNNQKWKCLREGKKALVIGENPGRVTSKIILALFQSESCINKKSTQHT